MRNLRQIAEQMMQAAIHAVDPYHLILDHARVRNQQLIIRGRHFNLNDFKHIYVIGAGKASAAMAQAVETLLPGRISDGAVVVKYGHAKPTKTIRILEAGHPIPDENSLAGTRQMLRLAEQAGADDLVIVLLSGGGSALMEWLPEGISLDDLRKVSQALLACGADIEEINTIRKHLSLVKGGRLAQAIAPAHGLTLILSDVIGDPPEIIASGPTVPDPSTFAQAWQIVEKYGLQSEFPVSVLKYLQAGLKGAVRESPKANDPAFQKMSNLILGNNLLALQKAAETAQMNGLSSMILTDRVQGEVQEIAKLMAGIFIAALKYGHPLSSPGCLILGGEPTVTLSGNGKGGRNQEMALAVLKEMKDFRSHPFYFCSVGTDGTDGPTDAAGAWIDQDSPDKAAAQSLDLNQFLKNHDSYHFFQKMNQLIITGPTGTNVMDMMLFLF